MTTLRTPTLTLAAVQLTTGEQGTDWRARRACTEADAELFFPKGEKGPWDEARAICAECPVRQICLDDALDRREPHGMWGGKTPEQRAQMLRSQRRRAARVAAKAAERACGDAMGTPAGEKRHRRAGQRPCESCLAASARYRVDLAAKRRAAQ